MKRLEISRLMDEYVDGEFFPEGGSTADTQAVKARVMANVGAAPKKQMPRKKKMFLAGVLAAILVVLVGAGFPSRLYQLATGSVEFYQDEKGRTIRYRTEIVPLELEDGQLFYVLDGEHISASKLMDEDTPYIRDLSNPDEGMTCYLIMGGIPENYGWFQWVTVPNPFAEDEDYVSIANPDGMVDTYDFSFTTLQQDTPYSVGGCGSGNPDWRMFSDFKEEGIDVSRFQWLRAAADELGIPFIDSTGEIVTTISEP